MAQSPSEWFLILSPLVGWALCLVLILAFYGWGDGGFALPGLIVAAALSGLFWLMNWSSTHRR